MCHLAAGAVVVDCVCLCFCGIGTFRPAESLSVEMAIMIDWPVIEIVYRAPVETALFPAI